MKILGVSGSPVKNSNTDQALKAALAASGLETEFIKLSEYKVEPYQLPRIRTSDPAVKAIGARAGDIVRIIRKSDTAGKYLAYRYVVEG